MNTHQGFSLIEVLIALCLVSTVSYGLLTQQRQITPLFQQMTHRIQALIEQANQTENKALHHSIQAAMHVAT